MVFLLVGSASLAVRTSFSGLNTLRKLDVLRKAKQDSPESEESNTDSKSFMAEYSKNQDRGLTQEPEDDSGPDSPDDYQPPTSPIDENFETKEITDAIKFIEFKMDEVNTLIKECIDNRYSVELMADVREVRKECVGNSFQILIINYRENIKKIKEILVELVKIKLEALTQDHDDEVNFFLDILDQLIEADFSLPESLQVVKQSSQYYVSPRFFDKIITLASPELQAFHVIHKRLRDARYDLQKSLESHAAEEDQFLDIVQSKSEFYEKAFPAPDFSQETRKLTGKGGRQGHHHHGRSLDQKGHVHHHHDRSLGHDRGSHKHHHKHRGLSHKVKEGHRKSKTEGHQHNLDLQKIKAKEGIVKLLQTKGGFEKLGEILQRLHSKYSGKELQERELLDQIVDPLERGNEMGWEPDDGKRGNQREDIMGARKPKQEL